MPLTSNTVTVRATDPKRGLTLADLKELVAKVEASGDGANARFTGRTRGLGRLTEVTAITAQEAG